MFGRRKLKNKEKPYCQGSIYCKLAEPKASLFWRIKINENGVEIDFVGLRTVDRFDRAQSMFTQGIIHHCLIASARKST